MKKFSSTTIKELKYYVYALTYRDNDKDIIFYIGKGKANRVFSHFNTAEKIELGTLSKENINSEKIDVINSYQTDAFIINARLTEKEAFLVEATLINTMRRFPQQELTNLVKGKKSFDPINANIIDSKISNPINLQDFCIKNKVNVLVLKSNEESYYSAINKDFRGVLEGVWRLSDHRMEQVDFVVGVLKGNIYAVYKYIKGSYKKIADENWTQQEWNRWNQIHITMGRPLNYFVNFDSDLDTMIKKRVGVMSLYPMAIPDTQKIDIPPYTEEEVVYVKKAKKLLNRDISDEKIWKARMSGRFYFGEYE